MRKHIYHLIILMVILVLADQMIKLLIDNFCMDADVILIGGTLFFHPVQNTHLWWIGSMFDIYMPTWMMVGILILCIVGLVFISVYFIYLFGKYRNATKVMCIGITFFVAGGVCMIVDIIFWGGSIDYIKLFDWFVFDLKDIYTKVYFIFLLLYYIPYMKEYIKMGKEERRQQGFLVWIKKGCPVSLK